MFGFQNESNLCTPRNGELIISATQDFLTGSYLLTNKDEFFTRPEACRIVSWCVASVSELLELPPPAIRKPMQLWTGKQLISLIFTPNSKSHIRLNLRAKSKTYSGTSEEMNPNDSCKEFKCSGIIACTIRLTLFGMFRLRSLFVCKTQLDVVVHNSQLMCGALDKATLGSGKTNVFYVLLKDWGKVQ